MPVMSTATFDRGRWIVISRRVLHSRRRQSASLVDLRFDPALGKKTGTTFVAVPVLLLVWVFNAKQRPAALRL